MYVVGDTQGEVLFDVLEVDLFFITDCWLILEVIWIDFIELLTNWIVDLEWARNDFWLFVNWAREIFKDFEFLVLIRKGMCDWVLIDRLDSFKSLKFGFW